MGLDWLLWSGREESGLRFPTDIHNLVTVQPPDPECLR
jgi:hypothetical protein